MIKPAPSKTVLVGFMATCKRETFSVIGSLEKVRAPRKTEAAAQHNVMRLLRGHSNAPGSSRHRRSTCGGDPERVSLSKFDGITGIVCAICKNAQLRLAAENLRMARRTSRCL